MIDFKATLTDSAYHDVDAQRAGVRDRRAGSAFRELRGRDRRPTPRRGQIQGQDQRGNAQVVTLVPLANMFGYAEHLKVDDPGRVQAFHMEYDHYEAVPQAASSTKWSRSTLR